MYICIAINLSIKALRFLGSPSVAEKGKRKHAASKNFVRLSIACVYRQVQTFSLYQFSLVQNVSVHTRADTVLHRVPCRHACCSQSGFSASQKLFCRILVIESKAVRYRRVLMCWIISLELAPAKGLRMRRVVEREKERQCVRE